MSHTTEPKMAPHHAEGWDGYSLDEIRYQKAFALARVEIQKEKLMLTASKLREEVPVVKAHGIAGKVLGSLNYLDYAVIAYRFASKIFTMLRAVKRRK